MPENSAVDDSAARPVQWMLLGLCGASALAFLAAHASPGLRIYARFFLTYSVAAAALLGWLAQRTHVTAAASALAVAGVLTAAGFVGLTLESWRMRNAEIRSEFASDPSMFLTQRMLQQDSGDGESERAARMQLVHEVAEQMRAERAAALQRRTAFGTYLRYRVSRGDREWSTLRAAAFFAAEIVLSGLVGAGIFRQFLPRAETATAGAGKTPANKRNAGGREADD